jgi:hypothetical protein
MAAFPGKDSAKMLKNRKAKKDAPKKDDAPAAGSDVDGVIADLEASLGGTDEEVVEEEAVEEEVVEDVEDVDAVAADDAVGAEMGDEGAKVFASVLGMDEMTAQAVYNEAMALPELAEMSPEEMAKKIDNNYELLKSIIVSMGEKAAMAMQDSLNEPAPPPELAPPGAGELPPGM